MKTQEELKQSLLQEKTELQEKFNKLINFINSEEYYKLSDNYKTLLVNQKIVMEMYLDIINKRLYEDIDKLVITNLSWFGLLGGIMTNNMFSQQPKVDTEVKSILDKIKSEEK